MLLCWQPTSLAPVHSRCSVNNICALKPSTALSPPGWGYGSGWLELQKAPSACLFAAADAGPIDSVSFFSPPPSPHSDSGSGSFQRLKAKLLESLCFYPPICSHLVGPGRGAAWPLAMLEGKCPLLERAVLCPSPDHSGLWEQIPAEEARPGTG